MSPALKALRTLIVPGLRNSGDGHWQTLWQQQLAAQRVEQRNWNLAELTAWTQHIVEAARADPRPALLVAHSFGCLAAVQALAHLSNVAAVLLVAPASPAKFGLHENISRRPLGRPAILVGSDSDPWLRAPEARQWARLWDCRFLNLGDAGHINTASGYGPWPDGLDLLEELARRAQRRDLGERRPARPQRHALRPATLAGKTPAAGTLQFLY